MLRQQTYIKVRRCKVVMKIAPFPSETRALGIVGLYDNIRSLYFRILCIHAQFNYGKQSKLLK